MYDYTLLTFYFHLFNSGVRLSKKSFVGFHMARDFVARGRPLRSQTRLAPLAKRSTCSKSMVGLTFISGTLYGLALLHMIEKLFFTRKAASKLTNRWTLIFLQFKAIFVSLCIQICYIVRNDSTMDSKYHYVNWIICGTPVEKIKRIFFSLCYSFFFRSRFISFTHSLRLIFSTGVLQMIQFTYDTLSP